jgi:hypothetical protein
MERELTWEIDMDPKSQMQDILMIIEEQQRLPEALEFGLEKEVYAIVLEPMTTYLKMIEGVEIVKDATGKLVEIVCVNPKLTANGKQLYEIGILSDSSRIIL